MKKSTYIFLCIITCGIYKIHINKKAKQASTKINDELITSHSYDFDINTLMKDLGGEENIQQVSSTLNNVIINLKDVSLINTDLKQKYKISGIHKTNHQLILVFGDTSQKICNDLQKLI